MSLQPTQCLEILKKSQNDNERLAALLIIAKHSDSSNFKESDFGPLLEAIGINFLCRLLKSAKNDQNLRVVSTVMGSFLLSDDRLLEKVVKEDLVTVFTQSFDTAEAIQCQIIISRKKEDLIQFDLCIEELKRIIESNESTEIKNLLFELIIDVGKSPQLSSLLVHIFTIIQNTAEPNMVNISKLLQKISTEDFLEIMKSDETVVKETVLYLIQVMTASQEETQIDILLVISLISNKISLAEISTWLKIEEFEVFLRLSAIQLQHLLMTNRNTSENYDLFSFFTLLDEYLEIFIHEDITKSQVLLSKLTAEVLERLETQITALVAVLSGVLHFSDDEDIILATCKFLSNWLQCEMRAISSHAIAENLIELATYSKDKDLEIYGAFLSGFYKGTDSEDGAKAYFEKTELITICRNNFAHKMSKNILDLSGNIIIEYLIHTDSYQIESKIDWTKFADLAFNSKVDITVLTPMVLKCSTISNKVCSEKPLKKVMSYLKGAFIDGKLVEEYIDPDLKGTDQVDITWIRGMSYLIEVTKQFENVREMITNSDWPSQIMIYLQSNMLQTSSQQTVVAVFSNLLQTLQI